VRARAFCPRRNGQRRRETLQDGLALRRTHAVCAAPALSLSIRRAELLTRTGQIECAKHDAGPGGGGGAPKKMGGGPRFFFFPFVPPAALTGLALALERKRRRNWLVRARLRLREGAVWPRHTPFSLRLATEPARRSVGDC